ncbi:MAG: type IV pilus assembly protein PilM [Phycisphaeraceae bacterium]
MPRKNDSWGIEVGTNAIKAMRLVRAGDEVDMADYEILPFKQILTTPDLNVEEAIQVQLDKFLAKHDLSNSAVIVSVPGHAAFARFAKLPPVEPKKIPDIVRFEAQQQIPFPIDQVEWDYQVFQQEDSPDVEVGIFAITKERVLSYLNNYRQVGIDIDEITLSPLAVYNAFHYEAERGSSEGGTIYMDIGTQSTDVIIVEAGGIWLRTLPIGGNNFTEALVRAFKLSFPKAEKLKREAGTSKYARQIFQAMRPVFADLVQELQRSLGYYQNMNRDANLTRLVGVGSTFRLPGLQKFLKQQLQLDVKRPEGFRRLQVPQKREAEIAEHGLNLATAYGLALQGLGLEQVSANVMPRYVLQQRMWRAKQPWIAAAAACVAVAVGAYATEYYTTTNSHSQARTETEAVTNQVVGQARGYTSQWDEISGGRDPRQQLENLRRILDYRDLWPKVVEDIDAAAQAMGPQAETIRPDYDAMASVPRAERRRIFIDAIETEYTAGQQQASPAMGAVRRARASTSTDLSTLLGGSFSVADFFSGNERPTFTVRITGTTPNAGGADFVSQTFIRYLRQNADRRDRPYRLVIPSNPYVEFDRVEAVQRPTGSERDDTGFEDDMLMQLEQYQRSAQPRSSRRSGRGVASQRAGLGDVAHLLPERPLANEARSQDWRFTIEWQVELRPPDEARGAGEPVRRGQPEASAPDAGEAAEADGGEARREDDDDAQEARS